MAEILIIAPSVDLVPITMIPLTTTWKFIVKNGKTQETAMKDKPQLLWEQIDKKKNTSNI